MKQAGMNQDFAEKVSALIDGELPADEARFMLRRVESDADLRAAIGRYDLIRACLRKELPAVAPDGFRADVMARIDAESNAATEVAAPRQRGWLRAAGGGLIAASVAAAALIAVAPKQPGNVPGAGIAAVEAPAAPAPTLGNVTPIRTEDLKVTGVEAQPAAAGIPVGPSRVQPVIYDPQLEGYLMRHSNALANSRGGFVPYVYVVSSPRQVAAQEKTRVPVLRTQPETAEGARR